MKDFWQTEFLDNTVLMYAEVAITIIIALLIKRLISKLLANLLYKFFAAREKQLERRSFIQLILKPLETFLLILVIIISLNQLNFPDVLDFNIYKISSKDLIDGIINFTLVIIFIRLCLRLIKFVSYILEEKAAITPDHTDNQLIVFFRDFFRAILVIIGLLLILKFVFHYNIGNLVTGLSIVGAALALATRESLENLIASFIIFFDKPFTTGDWVKVQSFTGQVEKIGLRSTRIRTDQKTYISVPNKQMVDTILDNITLRTQRRADINLELDIYTTTQQLQMCVGEIKKMMNREYIEMWNVYLSDTGKNAHVIHIDYFTSILQGLQDFNEQKEEIMLSIIHMLKANNIELAAHNQHIIVSKNYNETPEEAEDNTSDEK